MAAIDTVLAARQAELEQLIVTDNGRSIDLIQALGDIKRAQATASGGSGVAIVGDLKTGLQLTDHNGWVLLDGRARSTLTPTQQAAAASLGAALGGGSNLPNGTNRVLVGGSVGQNVGSSSITQANLPNINLSGGNHGHTITDPGHSHTIQGRADGTTGANHGLFSTAGTPFAVISSSTTGVTVQPSGALTIPLGGSGAAYTPLGLGANHFVYLGQ